MTAVPVLPLDGLRAGDRSRVGGKCASLGELLAGGLPVPPGFVVPVDAWDAVTADGAGRRLEALVGAADPADPAALRAVHAAASDVVHGLELPAGLADAVRAAYAGLAARCGRPDPPVAVRSSAVAEDGGRASFAGQQETYLWVRGADDVLARLRDCWAGLYTPQAIAYRSRLDAAHRADALRIAVGVQQMVDAEVAGVVFTVSPATGDPSVMAVNAGWGLGEAVVSGVVTPDEYWVKKVGLTVSRRRVTHKGQRSVPCPSGSGTRLVDVPPHLADAPCLDDGRVRELATLALRVEEHCGGPQDVEWAMAREPDGGHRFLLLQSRPETVSVRARALRRSAAEAQPAASYLAVLRRISADRAGRGAR